jgi:Homeodomain-like domain-containing protein
MATAIAEGTKREGPAVARIMPAVAEVTVSAEQRRQLEKIVARPSEGTGLVRRARVILLSASGETGSEIALRLDPSSEAVSRIRARFHEGGVEGLNEQPKAGRKDHAVPSAPPIVPWSRPPRIGRRYLGHPRVECRGG